MFDGLTLDQLRVLVTIADEGSFSAAGRKLRRVQSAVSYAMSTLESQLGLQLWDRTFKRPRLTEHGQALLAAARRVLGEADGLKRLAAGLVGGLEPSVAVAVDALAPVRALVNLGREFAERYPTVQLSLVTDTLSAVSRRVQDGSCRIGVIGPAAASQGLERQHLAPIRLVPVTSPAHPLARLAGRIPTEELARHVQIVFSERGTDHPSPAGLERPTPDQGVLSLHPWRVADLGTKHAMLLGGLGWGNMPEHLVHPDLAAGRLVRLRPAAWGDDEWVLSLSVVKRTDATLGPASRWVLERLRELCLRETGGERPTRNRPRRR